MRRFEASDDKRYQALARSQLTYTFPILITRGCYTISISRRDSLETLHLLKNCGVARIYEQKLTRQSAYASRLSTKRNFLGNVLRYYTESRARDRPKVAFPWIFSVQVWHHTWKWNWKGPNEVKSRRHVRSQLRTNELWGNFIAFAFAKTGPAFSGAGLSCFDDKRYTLRNITRTSLSKQNLIARPSYRAKPRPVSQAAIKIFTRFHQFY